MNGGPSQQARMDIAADRDARFDWDAWSRDIDAGLVALERLNQIEAQQAQANIDMARDVRAIIEDSTQGAGRAE